MNKQRSMVNMWRNELVDFLEVKRVKALKRQNMAKVWDYTILINYTKRQASSREIAEFYLEYWNSHKATQVAQLELF